MIYMLQRGAPGSKRECKKCKSIAIYTPSAPAKAVSRGADIPESVIFMAASGEHELALEVNFPEGFYGGFSFGLYDGMKRLQRPSYEKLFEHAREVVKDRLELSQEPQIVAKGHLTNEPAFGSEMLARKLCLLFDSL